MRRGAVVGVLVVALALSTVAAPDAALGMEASGKKPAGTQTYVKKARSWLFGSRKVSDAELIKLGRTVACLALETYGSIKGSQVAESKLRERGLDGALGLVVDEANKYLCPKAGASPYHEYELSTVFVMPPNSLWGAIQGTDGDVNFEKQSPMSDIYPLGNAAAIAGLDPENSIAIVTAVSSSGSWLESSSACVELLDATNGVIAKDCGSYTPGKKPIQIAGASGGSLTLKDFPNAVSARFSGQLASLSLYGYVRCRIKPVPTGWSDVDFLDREIQVCPQSFASLPQRQK